jgi:hypothetical protein
MWKILEELQKHFSCDDCDDHLDFRPFIAPSLASLGITV